MFSISYVRAKARQIVNTVPGGFTIALVPVALTVLGNLLTFAKNLTGTVMIASVGDWFSHQIFPFFFNILLGFLLLSIYHSLFALIRKQEESLSYLDAFQIFHHPRFWFIVKTCFIKEFFLFLWSIPFYIGLALYFLVFHFIQLNAAINETVIVISTIGSLVLMLSGIALLIFQRFAYFLVECILFDQLEKEKQLTTRAILSESRQLMKGIKGQAFLLQLSFIGWSILSLLSFGIVSIYVYPYFLSAQVYFYEEALLRRERKIAFFATTSET